MYYIDDYKQRAIDKIIPYLIEFPQIVKIIESNADRYQAIEDIMWEIANNFRVIDSRGVFLNAHANNEVTNIIYTDKAEDAFTYGTDMPLFQAYGTGHYYSQGSYISGIKKSVSEDKLIRAVQAKIIQNNTNGTVEDIIEALKLMYNAEHVRVFESNPLNLSIMLIGGNLEISSSGNYETIKQFIPACVNFNNIFVDTSMFDLFMYDENSSYGDTRYPIRVADTVDKYYYVSFSVNLDSEFEEYITTNHDSFKDNMFACITGSFTKTVNNGTIISSYDSDTNNNFRIKLVENESKYYFAVDYNGQTFISNYEVIEDGRYTIVAHNINNTLKVWFSNKIPLKGKLLSDTDYVNNVITSLPPDISIENFSDINAPIYINCFNQGNTNTDFGDFTYYAMIFGDIEDNTAVATEYYTSCYGEKQILFNCLENKNHLYINTNNPLVSNIMTKQSYYNYKQSHSAGKYVYLDGKSGIDYRINNEPVECYIDNFNIEFDVCMPVEISTGNIISNFVNQDDYNSNIHFNNDGSLSVVFSAIDDFDEENIDETLEQTISQYTVQTGINTIKVGEYASFRVVLEDNVKIYKNNNLIYTSDLNGKIFDMSEIIKIGYNNDLSSFYKGFIKNVNIVLNGHKENILYKKILNIPFKNRLEDDSKIIPYVNYGARFITVPQLIEDRTNLDLYGNELLGIRVYKE